MTLKKFSLITLICGIALTFVGLIPFILLLGQDNASIGIIGGASMPTLYYMLKSSSLLYMLIDLGIRLVLTALVCLIFGRHIKANCTVATSLISVGISASVAMFFAFGYMCLQILLMNIFNEHTLRFIIGIVLCIIGLAVSVVLVSKYIKRRKNEPKCIGILIDIFTAILYFPLFSLIFSSLV